ncbi:MAG: hypothetical protein IIU77_07790 [Clostridia bacterium]|nr:hypothetical protein [Clostridia bacterium]
MKKEEWNEGLNNIDSDLVEKYVEEKDKLSVKKKRKAVLVRIVSAAACFALILSAIIVVPMLAGDNIPVDIPVWDDARYSATDISKLFDTQKEAIATNAYVKRYVSDSKYLYIDEIPSEEYLSIYQFNVQKRPLKKNEFKDFIDTYLPGIADSLNINVPKYEIKKEDEVYFRVHIESGSYSMNMSQTEIKHRFSLYSSSKSDRKMILDGETVQIDQRMSDEEIINSLKSVKNKLFDIFNVSFSDAKVIRYFDYYSEYGATNVMIYFYDESANPINSLRTQPISDYICISFDNFANYEGDIVSESILTVADIEFIKMRVDVKKEYEVIGKAKKISLEKAEELLYKGYVFGGHSCPLCMEAQEKISFDNYDFVDIEYVFGRDYSTNYPTEGVPFYAFYKKIGTAKNGNICYAKTYVAAIQVSGYKEYFESQKDSHRSTNEYFD